jgi:hypothetical protein
MAFVAFDFAGDRPTKFSSLPQKRSGCYLGVAEAVDQMFLRITSTLELKQSKAGTL